MELIRVMVKELSSLKYCYKEIVEGCYDLLTENYNIPKPKEKTKEEVVEEVMQLFKNINL
jgi:radical SAM superfamily enzyme with C-terminal helix-hairpin-helix motif